MDIYEKSRGILLINIVIIWYMLDVFGPSAKFIVEFSTYIILLLCTLYLINDNIFSYDEKYKKIAFIFTGILILLHFFTNMGEIEDMQVYSFVYAFLRARGSFLAVLEAIVIIEGIIKSRFKKK